MRSKYMANFKASFCIKHCILGIYSKNQKHLWPPNGRYAVSQILFQVLSIILMYYWAFLFLILLVLYVVFTVQCVIIIYLITININLLDDFLLNPGHSLTTTLDLRVTTLASIKSSYKMVKQLSKRMTVQMKMQHDDLLVTLNTKWYMPL